MTERGFFGWSKEEYEQGPFCEFCGAQEPCRKSSCIDSLLSIGDYYSGIKDGNQTFCQLHRIWDWCGHRREYQQTRGVK